MPGLVSSKEQIAVLKYGGSGRLARFICGFLYPDQRFDPLLKFLPAMLCVRARGSTLVREALDAAGGRAQPIEHRAGDGMVVCLAAVFDQ